MGCKKQGAKKGSLLFQKRRGPYSSRPDFFSGSQTDENSGCRLTGRLCKNSNATWKYLWFQCLGQFCCTPIPNSTRPQRAYTVKALYHLWIVMISTFIWTRNVENISKKVQVKTWIDTFILNWILISQYQISQIL